MSTSLLFLAFPNFFSSFAYAGYTGPELKIPMEPGNAIRCTTEPGGNTMFPYPNDYDEYHSDSKNGYYSIDFDDRYSGDLVLAAADGTINSMDDSVCSTKAGCYVMIDHGGGYKTAYFHLASGSIPDGLGVGSHVNMAETIGVIGSTGGSTGTHLHFSISYNGDSLSTTNELAGVELDGINFVDYQAGSYYYSSNDGTCTLTTVDTYTDPYPMGLVTITEDGSAFDFHQYYVEGREYVLLNRGDMGTEYANPVINDQGSTTYHYQWLSGDVDGDGYTDIVEVQHTASTVFREEVWLSNGDGSFQSEATWQTVSTGDLTLNQNHYFLADVSGDGKADVVIARDEGTSSDVTWYQCLSSGSGFNSCTGWNSSSLTWGQEYSENTFLLGDVTGDGKADLVRGYNTSDQTDTCTTTGYNRKWRVVPGGSTTSSSWGDNWGCTDSAYLLGDVTGDGKKDLVQIRFDDISTGHVFVKTSTGTTFDSGAEWMEDFGSSNFTYALYDVMGDYSKDALLSHSPGNKVRVTRSSGANFKRSHTYSDEIEIEATSDGTWLPGHYGDLAFKTGTEEVCENSVTSMSSEYVGYDDGTLWDVDGTVYEYWTSDNAWHGYGSSDIFNSCGSDWASIEEVSSSIFSWETEGSVISNSFQCGVTHAEDVYAWNGTAYLITSDGTKRGFTSPDVFIGCGFAWSDLDYLAYAEYAVVTTLSDGSPISYLGDCGYTEAVILRELSSGELYQWTMSGSSVASSSRLRSSDLNWSVDGVGDFDRNGYQDLVWRHLSSPYELYLWLMSGTSVLSSVQVASSTNSGWDIRGVADFTGNGEPDILWRNPSTGELSLWVMNQEVYETSLVIASSSDVSWDITAVGDLTTDGLTDILWRNPNTGELSLWEMDGTSYVTSITVASSTSTDWDVEAMGDFNSDGQNDLLWRNPTTGDMGGWQMEGTSYGSFIYMASSSAAWEIVGVGTIVE